MIKTITKHQCICNICGHKWEPRKEDPKTIAQCTKCKSQGWNKERRGYSVAPKETREYSLKNFHFNTNKGIKRAHAKTEQEARKKIEARGFKIK